MRQELDKVDEGLKARLEKANEKIRFLDKVAWVCAGIAAVFGLSGAWGAHLLSAARQHIDELQLNITKIEGKLDTWDKTVSAGVKAVTDAKTTSLAAIQTKRGIILADISAKENDMKTSLVNITEKLDAQKTASLTVLTNEHKILSQQLVNRTDELKSSLEEEAQRHAVMLESAIKNGVVNVISAGDSVFATKDDMEKLINDLTTGTLNLQCRGITVVNRSGSKAIDLSTNSAGHGAIELFNVTGSSIARLYGAGDDGDGYLRLREDSGREFLRTGVYSTSNRPFVELCDPSADEDSERRLKLTLVSDGGGKIEILNNAEKDVLSLYASKESGHGYIRAYDSDGDEFFAAGVYSDGFRPFLALVNNYDDKNYSIELSRDADGGRLRIYDENGTIVSTFGVTEDGKTYESFEK